MTTPDPVAEKRRRLKQLLLERASAGPDQPKATLPRVDGSGPARLSLYQERLWLADQLQPDGTAYTIPFAFRLRGPLDRPAFEAAIGEIVRRHETLRTTFASGAEGPTQVVHPPKSISIEAIDLTSVPPGEREQAGWDTAERLMAAPFDLQQGPLFRPTLIPLGPDDHIFVMVFHHIISDGWSIHVFFRELTAHYRALIAGGAPNLPDLPIQYRDFAAWHRAWAEGADAEPHVRYWRDRLAGAPAALDLPTDRPRPPVRTFRAGQRTFDLSETTEQALLTLCRAEQATPFAALLAAFGALLHRLSGQDDILIGAPYAGRGRPETEGLIGFFVNTVVLRTRFDARPSFRDLLEQMRTATREAHLHQDVPLERVIAEIKPPPDPSRTPLFQVFFNLLAFATNTFQLPDVAIEHRGGVPDEAKFDLTLYAVDHRPGLRLTLVYNADLFDAARIDEMLAQYSQLVDAVTSDPDAAIEMISLVTPRARAILPDPVAPLVSTWAGTVGARLARHAEQTPNHVALDAGAYQWRYGELHQAVRRVANALAQQGARPGAVVAVLAARDPSLLPAILAILETGAAFAILDPAYPTERLARIIDLADPSILIRLDQKAPLAPDLEALIAERRWTSVPLSSGADLVLTAARQHPAAPLAIEVGPDDVAYLAFTSGTTGTPKGIVGTHRPLGHFCEWYQETFGLGPSDRISMLSGLAHDPLLRDLLAPVWVGGTLCVPDRELIEGPGYLGRWLRDARVTVTHLTPPMVELIEDPGDTSLSLPSLRLACFGGDRLTRARLSRFARLAPDARIVNGYGTTETPQLMGYTEVDRSTAPETGSIPIGRGIADVQLLVLDRTGKLAGIGEPGEIAIRTPYLSAGYHRDPDLTAQRFPSNGYTGRSDDRVYRTGDLGRYRIDGAIDFIGRADRQIKIRGFRIELGDVEVALSLVPGVREAVASTDGVEPDQVRLVAYLAGAWDTPPDPDEIRRALAARLPAYAVPSAIGILSALPRTPNGKVDFQALPRLQSAPTSTERTPPRNAVELRLCCLWEEALEVPAVGIHDDFFALGGHSLVAVRLFASIEREFGQRLSLATLLAAPTVAQLATLLRETGPARPAGALVAIESRGNRRPLFCVHGIGGNVLNYVDLARELGPEQPFYGLQALGLDGRTPLLRTIDEMARQYLAALREVQPHGPYRLAGGCMGGMIAHAMATQLQQVGEQVELLALLDVPAPRPLTWRDRLGRRLTRHRMLRKPASLINRALVWWQQPPERRWARLRAVFRPVPEAKVEPLREARAQEATRTDVQQANYFAMKSHTPGIYRGRIVHFFSDRAPDEGLGDRRLAWADRATLGQEVIPIGGGDSGLMLTRPHVELLGKRLADVLDRSLPSDPAGRDAEPA